MVAVTEEILSKIHETNILLNSNMLEAHQAADAAKAVSREVLVGIDSLDKEIGKNMSEMKAELTEQLEELERDFNKEMNQLTHQSLRTITKDNKTLMDFAKSSSDTVRKSLEKQQELQYQQYNTLLNSFNKQIQEQNEFILEVEKRLLAKMRESLATEQNHFQHLDQLMAKLNNQNELQVKKLEVDNKSLKKFQKIWFISTFIAIILGYFLK